MAFARKVDPARNPEVITAVSTLGSTRDAPATRSTTNLVETTARTPPRRIMTDHTSTTGSHAPRFAYMLLTHKDPEHVEELTQRVLDLSPAGHVVIHHDLAADSLPWQGKPPARVHFVDRGRVLWGDWSIVEADAQDDPLRPRRLGADWYVMLSGEHRPVVDLSQWERATMAAEADAFVEAQPLPPALHFGRGDEDANRFLARCLHRWVTINPPACGQRTRPWACSGRCRGTSSRCTRSSTPTGATRGSSLGHVRRGRPKGTTFYKGTQWIGFNRRSAGADPRDRPGHDRVVQAWPHPRRDLFSNRAVQHTRAHGEQPDRDVRTGRTRAPDGHTLDGPRRTATCLWSGVRVPHSPARSIPHERPHIIKAIDERVDRAAGRLTITPDAEGPAA